MIKNLPAMQETQVRFLGREDSLKKEMATHSRILAWRIPWTETSGLQSLGLQESDTTEQLSTQHTAWCSEPKSRSVELLTRVQLFVTPRTIACQAPLSMEFSRQE